MEFLKNAGREIRIVIILFVLAYGAAWLIWRAAFVGTDHYETMTEYSAFIFTKTQLSFLLFIPFGLLFYLFRFSFSRPLNLYAGSFFLLFILTLQTCLLIYAPVYASVRIFLAPLTSPQSMTGMSIQEIISMYTNLHTAIENELMWMHIVLTSLALLVAMLIIWTGIKRSKKSSGYSM